MIYSEKLKEKKEVDCIEINGVVLDSETWHTGLELEKSKSENESEKTFRKFIGLPITKQLIYFPDAKSENSKVEVLEYRLLEYYTASDPWAKIEILTEEGKKVKIHSDYFVHMQKPSFIKDMKEMGNSIQEERNT